MKVEWKRYRLPLRRRVKLAQGPALAEREGVVLRVVFEDGQVGYGDAAPLPGWSRESLDEVLHQLARGAFENPSPSLEFALESARRAWAPARPRVRVPLAQLVLPDALPENPRAQVLKLKLSGRLPEDLEWLRRIGARLAPRVRFRLDANRRYAFDEALRLAEACEGLPVEFLEEPTFETPKLEAWPRISQVPLAVDETLRELGPLHPACQAASFFVMKPTLSGGWETCLRLASLGKPCVISACFESDLGIHALGELAAAVPGPRRAAGLDTLSWLERGLLQDMPWEDGVFPAGEPLPKVLWDELGR